MSMIGSYRLVNAIENGTYTTHGALTTALGTAKTKAEFQGAVRNRELLRRLMSNETSVPLVLDSTAASPILYASNAEVLCDVLPDSYEYMKAVVTAYARFSKLAAVPGMIDALHRSEMATKVINVDAVSEVFRNFPFYFTKIPASGPILEAVYSSTYGTTVAITGSEVLVKRNGQYYFSTVAVGTDAFIPKDITVNADGTIIVVVGHHLVTSMSLPLAYYSTDGGNTWLASNLLSSTNVYANSILFGSAASIFAIFTNAGAVATIYTSSDGATWTSRTTAAFTSANPRIRAYNGGTYVFGFYYNTQAYAFTATSPTGTWTATAVVTAVAPTSLAGIGATNFIMVGEGTTGDGWAEYCNGVLTTWTGATLFNDTSDWDPTNIVASSTNFIVGINNVAAGTGYGGNISAAIATSGVPTVTPIAGPADNIRTMVACGRDLVLYTSDSATYGAFIGSYNTAALATYRNVDGTVFSVDATTPPFITAGGIYINAADGEVYCSNIPKK